MNKNKGFAVVATLMIAFGIIVLGGAGYIAMNPEILRAPATENMEQDASAQTETNMNADANMNVETSISWRLESAGEIEAIPYTNVTAVVNGTAYDMGKFAGSCSEIGANGGIDGKGLVAGELSAMQCWFAGSGNEIGVFAHEDGGFDIMVGELSEGEEGSGMFRGGFNIKNTIEL